MLGYIARKRRKKSHMEFLWTSIHTLRQEIIEDVLWATRDEENLLCPEALVRKANLIRKYSRRLKAVSL